MQQRVVTLTAVAGLAAFGVLAGVQRACSQQPGQPVRAAVTSNNPTGQTVNGTVASDAAYGERAGEGRNTTPAFSDAVQEGLTPGASQGFGRPNPGRPAYEDPEYQGAGRAPAPQRAPQRRQPQGGGQSQAQNDGGDESGEQGRRQADGDDTVLTVNDGFFFDNYTSGSGFGVYGGEAVTSGQGQQLNLPSAGVNARNLGLPVLPNNQPVGNGLPQQPIAPPVD